MPNSFKRALDRLPKPNRWTLTDADREILEIAHRAVVRERVMERRLTNMSTETLLQPIYEAVERAR